MDCCGPDIRRRTRRVRMAVLLAIVLVAAIGLAVGAPTR